MKPCAAEMKRDPQRTDVFALNIILEIHTMSAYLSSTYLQQHNLVVGGENQSKYMINYSRIYFGENKLIKQISRKHVRSSIGDTSSCKFPVWHKIKKASPTCNSRRETRGYKRSWKNHP